MENYWVIACSLDLRMGHVLWKNLFYNVDRRNEKSCHEYGISHLLQALCDFQESYVTYAVVTDCVSKSVKKQRRLEKLSIRV
jgi:hypothetical protein